MQSGLVLATLVLIGGTSPVQEEEVSDLSPYLRAIHGHLSFGTARQDLSRVIHTRTGQLAIENRIREQLFDDIPQLMLDFRFAKAREWATADDKERLRIKFEVRSLETFSVFIQKSTAFRDLLQKHLTENQLQGWAKLSKSENQKRLRDYTFSIQMDDLQEQLNMAQREASRSPVLTLAGLKAYLEKRENLDLAVRLRNEEGWLSSGEKLHAHITKVLRLHFDRKIVSLDWRFQLNQKQRRRLALAAKGIVARRLSNVIELQQLRTAKEVDKKYVQNYEQAMRQFGTPAPTDAELEFWDKEVQRTIKSKK